MMKKNILLSTALAVSLAGFSFPAAAQQYLEHYKTADTPAVQVDMSALGAAQVNKPQAAPATTSPSTGPAPQTADTSANVATPAPMAAQESAPAKTLLSPLFTQMSPSAITGAQAPVHAEKTQPLENERHARSAAKPAQRQHSHHLAALPPKPRHKPQTATVSLDNEATAPIAQPIAQGEASQKQPVLMLSLPSHMPPLAVDSAKMPPLGAASAIVPAPAQEPQLTAPAPKTAATAPAPQETHETPAPVAQAARPSPAAQAARPSLQKINDSAAVAPAPAPKADSDSMMPATTRAQTMAQVEDAQADMQRALALQNSDGATTTPAISENAPVTPAVPATTAEPPLPGTLDANHLPVVPTLADLTLSFAGNSSDLSPEAQRKLDSIVNQLRGMPDGRIQVRGFASGENGGQSSARRISLSRVLSVRSYLMDKGIKPTRVDVRAQGSDTDRTPLDRVDLLFEH